METLTLLLFERMGILLMFTFILTRIPLFRQLLDREVRVRTALSFSLLFGLFGVAGTYAGVLVKGTSFLPSFWIFHLEPDESIAHAGLVGVVIGGLLGGPVVGVGAGLLTGLHLYSLGGMTALSGCVSAPITGLLVGFVARFFTEERVISPAKSLFIGMFAPILLMGMILIFSTPPDAARTLVNIIGIPMVLTNSISIAIFTTMIRVALKEEERSAAIETERALKIAELILPHLKLGLTPQTARAAAQLLLKELKAAAVAVSDTEQILAHVGIGADHHLPGERIKADLARRALLTGQVQVGLSREHINCRHPACGLAALLIVPVNQAGRSVGLLKLYFKRPQQIRKVEEVLAQGLSNLISNQLTLALAERITGLMKDAELRMLQAQIHPHFLFNTLNSIVTLIRVNPDLARHMTIQLAVFLRMNLKMTSAQLVSIEQELSHLNAYLEIVRIRFAEQFTVSCEVESGIEHVMIPPGTFQPLVENSILHGLKEKTCGGFIRIALRRRQERVEVLVEDNGTGIPPEILDQLGEMPVSRTEGNGIGVHNVNQRLISLFGPDARLRFANRAEGGCQIRFSIPIMK
ncbi:GAF domain-containing protein [Brevibacillus sp. SYP-B805]|uniref:LytS/YhcK type 5TM receptor domain-containing protein n=1 Tax=Brevibacillus sp. SYP-B805 TaxID=1578199 RepID=UPI0013EC2911|nr:LytS/YhcK type 5TM receptor domain-containing protein [Brevibacillus sp. SYP-B805]NGQ97468.1 GAF domain-containing protein [Brevibacillus sp. SYP-B805]